MIMCIASEITAILPNSLSGKLECSMLVIVACSNEDKYADNMRVVEVEKKQAKGNNSHKLQMGPHVRSH